MSKKRHPRQIGHPAKANPVDKDSVDENIEHPQELEDPIRPPGERRDVVVTEERSVSSFYLGPLPPPHQLEEYDRVIPGSAERIISMAERQQQHRLEIEKALIYNDIGHAKLGVWAGLAVAFLSISVGGFLIYCGHDWAGGSICTATLASLVGVFIYGTSSRRHEREDKIQVIQQSSPESNGDNEE